MAAAPSAFGVCTPAAPPECGRVVPTVVPTPPIPPPDEPFEPPGALELAPGVPVPEPALPAALSAVLPVEPADPGFGTLAPGPLSLSLSLLAESPLPPAAPSDPEPPCRLLPKLGAEGALRAPPLPGPPLPPPPPPNRPPVSLCRAPPRPWSWSWSLPDPPPGFASAAGVVMAKTPNPPMRVPELSTVTTAARAEARFSCWLLLLGFARCRPTANSMPGICSEVKCPSHIDGPFTSCVPHTAEMKAAETSLRADGNLCSARHDHLNRSPHPHGAGAGRRARVSATLATR
ncbi:Uncharacterised protein [Mycobacteroides abscessus subsp. massiliense]|nr:Uncharacterised protein [Mycobacteroides abscessus subsp. massiliense]SKW44902.1 Uncharacterised protein [Mycobacteroides abscessus subsp. massiliense]